MKEVTTASQMREIVGRARCQGAVAGLVPTMGYLHAGHARLAAEAREENDLVVMSLFVNPTQFGQGEDFERYPRDLEHDRTVAAGASVDVLFVPDGETMYPGGSDRQHVWVDPGPLAAQLCGASRPGHFRGVATVVAKLLNVVQPDRAYFGQKDGLQASIVTRMVRDLGFRVEIRVVPTVREPDGLALSSRNVYLTAEEREQAPALSAALQWVRGEIERGEREPRSLECGLRECLQRMAPLARLDYATVAGIEDMRPSDSPIHDSLIAVAAYFGGTRLIDNLIVRFIDGEPTFS